MAGCIGILLPFAWPFIFPMREPTEPIHQGATEGYADTLHSLVIERDLGDTGELDLNWFQHHISLQTIEDHAIEAIDDVCTLAINMLNNDLWWSGQRYA